MVSLSLRLCHNFAGPGKITLTIVPPTQPDEARIVSLTPAPIPAHVAPASYANAWSNTLKTELDGFSTRIPGLEASYTTGGTWENSGLTLYMMTVQDANINWYSLSKDKLTTPTYKELKSNLEFLVTGAEGTWPG
eukprot:GHVU01021806.1.p2 GENE.GHVU01021806.1~~GHVU01021806.1.p2  ORF type:complete len:135 (+),score=12.06 GHVU01021806.1:64-468(+)